MRDMHSIAKVSWSVCAFPCMLLSSERTHIWPGATRRSVKGKPGELRLAASAPRLLRSFDPEQADSMVPARRECKAWDERVRV